MKEQLLAQIGNIKPPVGVPAGIDASGRLVGIIALVNSVLRLLFIAAGIWALFNIIIAGIEFINTGGDPKKVAKAWERIYMSLIGLVIIVCSFLIAAVIGIILFGDPSYILNPKLTPVK